MEKDENVMVVQLCDYTKNHCLKWAIVWYVNYINKIEAEIMRNIFPLHCCLDI